MLLNNTFNFCIFTVYTFKKKNKLDHQRIILFDSHVFEWTFVDIALFLPQACGVSGFSVSFSPFNFQIVHMYSTTGLFEAAVPDLY